MTLGLDALTIATVSLLICAAADRLRWMQMLVPAIIAFRMLAVWGMIRRRPSHSLTAEIVFFSVCLILGAFNDWNTVVRHRVYDYLVPSDLVPWSSIPSWMLLYWGMILRFMHTLSVQPFFQSPRTGKPAAPRFIDRWRVPIEIALVLVTRQAIYRFPLDPVLSWLPFAAALILFLLLFPLGRGERRLFAFLAIGGPLVEILYIRVGALHQYPLGGLGGVPLWIALWWILAGLIWKDLSPPIFGFIARAFPVANTRAPA
ncbi:MAG: hypothetical protein HYT87_04195 [Nitrospirae bacterium]|nr:hypothetical protein [Nitrospirota bacterium]